MILTAELREKLAPVLMEAMDAALVHASKSPEARCVFECRLDEVTALDTTRDGEPMSQDLIDAAQYWGVIE